MALLIACTHYITITAKDSTCSHPCPMLSFNIVTKEAENICNIPTGKESTDEKNTIRTAYGLPACVHAGCGRYTDKGRSSKYKRKFRAEDHATSEKISKRKILEPLREFVNNPDGWTDTPCTHHGNCLAKGYQGQCGCNSFSNAIQCMGFSEKLGYDVFGSAPRTWSSHTNLSKVKAGDVIRYRYNTHSVFVTKVTADTITFADCNWDGHCKIRWNVTIPKSSITGLTYIRHANNYDSVVKIPQTVKLTTAKNKATKKVWLKWNRSDKTSGYEVYRSTKKNSGYKKIKTINSAKNCSMTDKNRMIGKKYYYKIRAYRNVNGQRLYGSYSNIKSITIRK